MATWGRWPGGCLSVLNRAYGLHPLTETTSSRTLTNRFTTLEANNDIGRDQNSPGALLPAAHATQSQVCPH